MNDLLQQPTIDLLQRVTIDFLKRVTSATSNERKQMLQRVTSEFWNEQLLQRETSEFCNE